LCVWNLGNCWKRYLTPDIMWDAPFLAVNKIVVTMVRAIKE